MSTETLTFERRVNAPVDLVFQALTNATALTEWACDDARIDARPGGRVYLWSNEGITIHGEYTTIERNEKVAFTWPGRNGTPSQVEFKLAAQDKGTMVTLTHRGVGSEFSQRVSNGWRNSLENLQSVLETGLDLRFYNRPMLGIIGGNEVTPQLAAERHLPVTYGVQLQQFVPEMGAATAGLQSGDILVKLAETDIEAWRSLRPAVAKYKAGDMVKIIFYRGDRQMTAEMRLSGRPHPQVPDNAAELAEATRQVYARIDGELAELFEGVSEAEASRPPKEGEWNAKQVVAHLITTEIAMQAWIATLLSGDEAPNWSSNNWPWVDAVVSMNPTWADLLAELSRCERQTAALVANFPAGFVANKGSYLRTADTVLNNMPQHARTHLVQIRQALEAAKS